MLGIVAGQLEHAYAAEPLLQPFSDLFADGSTFDFRRRVSGGRSTGSLSARAIVLLLRPSSLAIVRRLFPRLCSRCTVLRSIRRTVPVLSRHLSHFKSALTCLIGTHKKWVAAALLVG